MTTIHDLPDDLVIHIASFVAASTYSDLRTLRQVSRRFQNICNHHCVLRKLSLSEIGFCVQWGGPSWHYHLYERLRNVENPEALYRSGLLCYFYLNRKEDGEILLEKAAKKGYHEAIFLYGFILLCLGVERRQEAFKLLSSLLIKPLMSQTFRFLEAVRSSLLGHRVVLKELQDRYVKNECHCDGRTKRQVQYNMNWYEYGETDDMPTSSACHSCIWQNQVFLVGKS